MAAILVVEDDPPVRTLISSALREQGHQVSGAANGLDAMNVGRRLRPELAVLDFRLPGTDGLQVFRSLRRDLPAIVGIVVTGYPAIASAFECGRVGITAYIEKPIKMARLLRAVHEALTIQSVTRDESQGQAFDGLIGASEPMLRLRQQILTLAPLDEIVLLIGETGTGKELVAKSLHQRSHRTAGPFVAVNCGAIQPTLFEATFFGHERGAFTGAEEARPGFFEEANGGTLFLDEIGELPLDMQPKLLRVIDEQVVRRVGGRVAVPVNVRILVATNLDLTRAIAQGTFRRDLYHRIDHLSVHLPPLRDRQNDVASLAEHFLSSLRQQHSRPLATLSSRAIHRLEAHDWLGNVRELQNALRKAFFAADGMVIDATHVEPYLTLETSHAAQPARGLPDGMSLHDGLHQIERQWIQAALERHGTLATTAKALGIDAKTLYEKRRRLGLIGGGSLPTG